MRSPAFGFIIILIVSAIVLLWAVGTIIYLVRHRRQKQRLAHGPICGRCGYAASLGPDGFTRCPECGGDYTKVGVLGPDTRTGNPAILLSAGLGWVLAVAIFMVIATFAIGQWLTVSVATTTTTQNGSWSNPRAHLNVDVTTVTTTITGRAKPTSDIATVDITSGAEKHTIVIDNNEGKIRSSTTAALPVGSAPSDAAVHKTVADLMSGLDAAEIAQFQSEAAQLIGKRAAAPRGMGIGMRSSSSSSTSLGGRGGLNSSTGTSTSGSVQSGWIGIGSTLISTAVFAFIMAAIGLVIAALGLWFLARTARPPARLPEPAVAEG